MAPPAPVRPAPAPPAPMKPGPSAAAALRTALFAAAALFCAAGTARRWADAYARFRAFQGFDASPLLAAAPLQPPLPPSESPRPGAAPKQPRAVLFHLSAPDAKAVLLGGSFNDFNPGQTPMTRRPDGTWEATLPLAPGRYAYKFKVDGRWTLDPANPEHSSSPREASLLDIQ